MSCDKHGRFAEEQCVGADCWCVDPETGQVIRDCSRHRNKRSLYTICQENRVQQLEAYYEFVSMGKRNEAVIMINIIISVMSILTL